MKMEIIKAEERILSALAFNVHVTHPYGYLINYLQALDLHSHQSLCQSAWNDVNDLLRTTVPVCYQPPDVACAVIYRNAKKMGIKLPERWWDIFGAFEDDLKDIGREIDRLHKIKDLSDLSLAV